jgi:hypothetical protein
MNRLATLALAFMLSGCSATLTPELIAALAKDDASFCGASDIRGGAGGGGLLAGAMTGGWGQSTFTFCRSNHAGAKVTVSPDGSISIEHK